MLSILCGILWGVFTTHNVEQTNYFKCKYDKNPVACEALVQLAAKEAK